MNSRRYQDPIKSLYDNFNLPKRRRRDISLTIFSFAAFYIYLPIITGAPISKFSEKLGAGDFFYSLLIAMPILGNALQIFASIILEKTKKRKPLFIICGIISRASWIMIGLIPLLLAAESQPTAIYWILLFMVISSVTNSMLGVGFFSWLGDLMPKGMMGRYYGLRESIGTIVSLATILFVSLYLDKHSSFESFAIVFAVAGAAGVIDILGFIFVTDVPMSTHPHPPVSQFIKKAFSSKSFLMYIVFWSLWALTFNMSVGFYNLYGLTYLKLSFMQVAVAGQIAFSSVAFFAAPRWGNTLDKSGVHHVMLRAGVISSVIPLVMIFSVPGSMWTYVVFSLLNGLSLTAVNTTAQKMLTTATPETNRTMYIALYSVITSVFAVVGYLLGGALLEVLGDMDFTFALIRWDRYKVLFSAAGLLRLAVILLVMPLMSKVLEDEN